MLQRLIELGSDIHCPDAMGCTPLHRAVQEGWIDGVKFLLENGAQAMPMDWKFPVNRKTDITKLLLENAVKHDRVTRRDLALCMSLANTAEEVSLFLKYGAPLGKEPDDSYTPLNFAIIRGKLKVVKSLLEAGASTTARDEGLPPLHMSLTGKSRLVGSQRLAAVKLLLQHGAPVDKKYDFGITPLGRAVNQKDKDLVKTLLENGANPHRAMAADGLNALHKACAVNAIQIARLLLDHGVDLGRKTPDGRTALHIASSRNRPALVFLLLEHNAPVNDRMRGGRTPLHIAVEKGLSHVVEILLKNGASPRVAHDNGTTALHLACSRGHGRLVPMLLGHKPDINAIDRRRKTALIHAASRGNKSVMRTLLQHGAHLGICDNVGWTAYNWLERKGRSHG